MPRVEQKNYIKGIRSIVKEKAIVWHLSRLFNIVMQLQIQQINSITNY